MITDPLLLTVAAGCAVFTLGLLYWLSRSTYLDRIVDGCILTLDDNREVFNGGFGRRGKYLVPDEATRATIKARVRKLYLWTFGFILFGLQPLQLVAGANQALALLGIVAASGVATRMYLQPLTRNLERFDGALTWSDRKANVVRYWSRFSTGTLMFLLVTSILLAIGGGWLLWQLWHGEPSRPLSLNDWVECGFFVFAVLLFGVGGIMPATELVRRMFGRPERRT